VSKVLILGGTGMLGHAVLEEFGSFSGDVSSTSRSGSGLPFDVLSDPVDSLAKFVGRGDYIINCLESPSRTSTTTMSKMLLGQSLSIACSLPSLPLLLRRPVPELFRLRRIVFFLAGRATTWKPIFMMLKMCTERQRALEK